MNVKDLGAGVAWCAAVVAAALLMPGSIFAKTTALDVPAKGGAWSALTWSNGVPEDGDTVILNNNNASAVSVENDTADTLAAIFTDGTSGVTITGRDLTLTGDDTYENTLYGVTYNYAISNEVPLVFDIPVVVASTKPLWHIRNNLTFNDDVSIADEGRLCLYRVRADCLDSSNADTVFYNLTFNGHFYATNATFTTCVYKNNKIIFNKSMHAKTHPGIGQPYISHFYFFASGNTWTEVGDNTAVQYPQFHMYAQNAIDPTLPMNFGMLGDSDVNKGVYFMHSDQEVNGISCAAPSTSSTTYGAIVQSDNYSTLYVRADESRTAYCQLGGVSSSNARLNVNFSAVGDNAGSVVQTLVDRSHTMTGALVVCSGTLRTEGKTRFLYLPSLTLQGGVFESACINAASSVEFPVLDRLHIASSAVFRIDSASTASPFASDTTTLSVEAGGMIEVPSGMTVSFKAVFYDGAFVASGTYTKSNCNWVDGDGSVVVSVPSGWNVWKTNADGSWTEASNWSNGNVPTADEVAVLMASKSDFTVSAEGISAAPSQIRLSGSNGKTATLSTGTSTSLSGHNLLVTDGGVLSVPDGSSVSADSTTGFTVLNGGEVSVAGSLSGTAMKASVGGRLYVTGSFAVTNTTANLFNFVDGAEIEIDGGLLNGYKAVPVYKFPDYTRNITVDVKNSGAFDVSGVNSCSLTFAGRDFTVSDSCVLKAGGAAFKNQFENTTNTVNILDDAQFTLSDYAALQLGYHSYGGDRVVLMNLSTSKPTTFKAGVEVGYGARGVLNVDGGHNMFFAGSYGLSVPRAMKKNERSGNMYKKCGGGEVNIRNGSIYCKSCSQTLVRMGGFHIACWTEFTIADQDEKLPGVLNVFKDGEARIDNTDGYGRAHFIVGCGRLTEGEVNVYGGKVINKSAFNPLVGQWGGNGAINVYDDGLVYMKETMVVGGSTTNDLISFKQGYNGGSDFYKYFALDDTTGEGVINVENGTFVVASNAVFSAAGKGSLAIGTNGLFVAKGVCLSNSVNSADSSANVSTLSVTFGSSGCGRVVCGTADETGAVTAIDGTLTVGKGAKLVVDASALTEPASRYIPLVQFDAMEGGFDEENITLIKPSDNSASNWSVVRTTRKGVDGYYLNAAKGGLVLIVR